MAHRGGGYTRGSGGYRHRGRPSPYWKENPRQQPREASSEQVEQLSTPIRESSNHAVPDQSPADASKGVKKFSNRARVFIANLPRDMSDKELRTLFEAHGEVQEVFVQKERNYGFCRMAYRSEAERAIASLNGSMVKGREIKVRFAASNSSVKVDNIHPLVSNELLREAFAQFGEVEHAVVVTDDRGKSKGYGLVDFARKQSAINAITQCKNAPFLLTRTPIPVVVSELERDNEDEGQPDKNLQKNPTFIMEHERPPRFAVPGEIEFMIASRWKAVFDEERAQRSELEARIKENRAAVREQLGNIKEQHKTELLRQELAHHQQQQIRLMQQLSEREGILPPASRAGMGPPGVPPLFPVDHAEPPPDPGPVTIPGLGGPLPAAGAFIPPPLMGQPPMNFEKFH